VRSGVTGGCSRSDVVYVTHKDTLEVAAHQPC